MASQINFVVAEREGIESYCLKCLIDGEFCFSRGEKAPRRIQQRLQESTEGQTMDFVEGLERHSLLQQFQLGLIVGIFGSAQLKILQTFQLCGEVWHAT